MSAIDVEAPTSFTVFEKLPLEMQCDIWKFASFLPRAVAIEVKNFNNGYEPASLKWFRWTSTTAVPALFSVCRASRHEAEKYYKRSFVAKQHSDFGFEITLVPRFYINPESDIICPLVKTMSTRHGLLFSENIRDLELKHVGLDDGAWDGYWRNNNKKVLDLRDEWNDNKDDSYMRELCGYWNPIIPLIVDASYKLESITIYTCRSGYDNTKPLKLIPLNKRFLGRREQHRADIIEYDITKVLIHNLRGWINRQIEYDVAAEIHDLESEPVYWSVKPSPGYTESYLREWISDDIYGQPPESLPKWVPPRVERMMTEDIWALRLRKSVKKPSDKL
ncbi:hypothetical protein SBOR_9008 [Sclerotinia borealis F-4128]|uniref:2EXR domain-containing protein n=1 Tax=Sclerotinia borealis (strain F-4128) TaxID=1432307 RepID=W9C3Z9_SCLBF|nr:hypothetical protein SBOR_9008 [Sclerotinia borealis F-4128]